MLQPELYAELLTLIQSKWTVLPDKPEETPIVALHSLWLFAGGHEFTSPPMDPQLLPELNEPATNRLHSLTAELINKVPLAYLIGKKKFMNIELLASPEAMIPRKETEIVGKAAVDTLRQIVNRQGFAQVIDLCTGSGTLALSMAYEVAQCDVVGADLSEDAVRLATRNAEHLGLSARVKFLQGDLFAPFETAEYLGQVDLITCNPPYIASAHVDKMPEEIQGYEPRLAFDGGPFGIQILTRLVREAHRFGKPGSSLCFEVGLGQGKAIANLLSKTGRYTSPEFFRDSAGEIRAIKAALIG